MPLAPETRRQILHALWSRHQSVSRIIMDAAAPPLQARSPFTLRMAAFWLACFSSIALLLGHLYSVAAMNRLFWLLALPCAVIMLVALRFAASRRDHDFMLRFWTGAIGGILGTIGYDIVRIPLHHAGLNPFAPIRFYGVWITGSDHSTSLTDLAGFVYHFSNGITFGWIYSFLLLRWHWLWAVLWALLLESVAVFCVFGEVFAIRKAYGVLGVAYAAHLFYGAPLGWICQRPEQGMAWFRPLGHTGGAWLSLLATALLVIWFPLAWQRAPAAGLVPPREIHLGPQSFYPGILDVPMESRLTLRNPMTTPVKLVLRHPGAAAHTPEHLSLAPGEAREIKLSETGIFQLLAPDLPWRSVLIAVHRDGDYRPGDH
ncbi:MAG: hypothetical protein ACAH88_11105 [Roseimicrobium sp.]